MTWTGKIAGPVTGNGIDAPRFDKWQYKAYTPLELIQHFNIDRNRGTIHGLDHWIPNGRYKIHYYHWAVDKVYDIDSIMPDVQLVLLTVTGVHVISWNDIDWNGFYIEEKWY